MHRFYLGLTFLACAVPLALRARPQQLPAPHAVANPTAALHTGGLGHFGEFPTTVAASEDGRIFAMNDGSVWNVGSGGVVGHLGKPLRVFYVSPRGTWLAFAEGNTVKLWTLASGEIRDFIELGEPVEHLAASPDESMLVAATVHGDPQLFQVATGTHLRNFVWTSERRQLLHPEASIAFSPDAKLLACGPEVWTVASGTSLFRLEGDFRAFTSDGRTLFSMVGNHTVEEWDLKTHQRSSMFDLSTSSSDRFIFRPDGVVGVLSLRLNANPLALWDTHAGMQTSVIRVPQTSDGYRVNFLGNSDWVIVATQRASLRLVRISTAETVATLDSSGKNWSVVRASDGAYDASADALGSAPSQPGRMFVDGTPVSTGQFKRVAGLLSSLPGAPVASSAKQRAQRR